MADVGSDTSGVQKTKESEQAATALDKVTDLVRCWIFWGILMCNISIHARFVCNVGRTEGTKAGGYLQSCRSDENFCRAAASRETGPDEKGKGTSCCQGY